MPRLTITRKQLSSFKQRGGTVVEHVSTKGQLRLNLLTRGGQVRTRTLVLEDGTPEAPKAPPEAGKKRRRH